MGNKLENLLNFNDFEKSWNSKKQSSTKRTEVGLDVLNEHLYMKVMDKESAGWEENVKKFLKTIDKNIDQNQVKDIDVDDNTAFFTIRGRKHKVDKENGSLTLYRIKATEFRKKNKDAAGRVREERKRTKITEEIEVHVPIGKSEASDLYEKIKEKSED